MSQDIPSETFDVAVIGGGVIGCAIARRFTLEGARVVLLEKALDILDGASKGNSAILHTGFDAPAGSLELACIKAGYAEYLEIHQKLNLPLLRSGAMVLAWTEEQEAALPALMEQARTNGIGDVQPLTSAEARALEPGLADSLRAAFRVPREFLVDPWSAPHAYLLQAIENGAVLLRDCEVTGGIYDGVAWRMETSRGGIQAKLVVNAAGLYGDIVDERMTGRCDFRIRPRKGQFVVYDKPAARLASHILLPVPSKTTKGIVVCRTIYGNLIVGPTAEEQEERDVAELSPATLASLCQRGEEILPALAGQDVTAIYAGLRPATEHKDYKIRAREGQAYISAGGIRSTGLSSALGVARYVQALAVRLGLPARTLPDPVWPRLPAMTDEGTRDWQRPGNGGIVCHCELVTRREIDAAMTGPLAPQTFAGLKRRTRVTMGRCQGFYCSAELSDMTREWLAVKMAEDTNAG